MSNTHVSPTRDADLNPSHGIVATVVCAGLVTALALYLAGSIAVRIFDPGNQCGEGMPCAPGFDCDRSTGTCYTPGPEDIVCGPGGLKETCYCPPPKAWIEGVCDYKPPPPAECDFSTGELLRALIETQQTCKARLHADVTSCAPGDIREFMLKNQQFNAILNKFRATTWVLFPESQPPLRGRWPTRRSEADHYAQGLTYDEALLEESSYILVLAHAPDDNDKKNDVRLQKRLEHGFKLIEDLAGDDIAKRNRWKRKFLAFPIPPEEPVYPDDFRAAEYANIVTWDDASQVRYGKMLDSVRGTGEQLSVSEWEELKKALNLSVTIVPIRCDAPPPRATR